MRYRATRRSANRKRRGRIPLEEESATTELIIACIAFVGTHFLLSHPLRAPLAGKMGEGPFLGLYSLLAFAALGWVANAFYMSPKGLPLWPKSSSGWS
ncbi:MAG: NnrU family protein [Sphingobium sp.]